MTLTPQELQLVEQTATPGVEVAQKVKLRPDQVVLERVRTRLLRKIEKDLDLIYDQIKDQLQEGHRDTYPRTQVAMKLLDKLLVEGKFVERAEPSTRIIPPPTNPIQINVFNVRRGTKAAREEAETVTTTATPITVEE